MSRTIAGTFLLPDGSPLANAKIYLEAKRTEALSILDGVSTFFSTNSSGIYSQSVVNGFYSVSVEVQIDVSSNGYRRWPLGDIVVEDGASTTLQALLIATNPPADVALTVFYEILAETQAARDAAVAAADAAAVSAASISVGTGGTQIPTNDIVKTTLDTRLGTTGNLGTAATLAVVSGSSDATAGRVITVPYMGLGAQNTDNLSDVHSQTYTGFFDYAFGATNSPDGNGGSIVVLGRGSQYTSLLALSVSGTLHYDYQSAGVWAGWRTAWDSVNLASPMTLNTAQTVGGSKTFSSRINSPSGVLINSAISQADILRIGMAAGGGYAIVGSDQSANFFGIQERDTAGAAIRTVLSADKAGALRSYYNTTVALETTSTGSKTFGVHEATSGFKFPSYTVSTVPSASANANVGVIVTNPASGGRRPYWSDGSNWYDAAHTLLS